MTAGPPQRVLVAEAGGLTSEMICPSNDAWVGVTSGAKARSPEGAGTTSVGCTLSGICVGEDASAGPRGLFHKATRINAIAREAMATSEIKIFFNNPLLIFI